MRDGKGGKDRVTLLPMSLMPALQKHLLRVRSLHHGDLEAGWGRVLMPYALARKYPNANREWAWQWVFPQQKRWRDRESGTQGRHHLDPSVVQKAVKRAVAEAGPGHLHHSGVAGPQGRENHHDLYPCAQPRPSRSAQPCRSCVAARTCGSRTRKPRILLGLPYLKPYAGTGFSRRARAPLGVVCGKPRGYWAWFSVPPNKELAYRKSPAFQSAMSSHRNNMQSPSLEVCIQVDGKDYRGSYRVEGRPALVYLTSDYGSKATQLGNSPADMIARVLLHDLVAMYQ